MTSRVAKARDLYIQGVIEVDEFERRVELALAATPDDPGEHAPWSFSDAPGSIYYYEGEPPTLATMADVLKQAWTEPRWYIPPPEG